MDNPLFGDENSKAKKIAAFSTLGGLGLIIAVTVTICLVFAFYPDIGHWQHAAFAGLILVYIVPFAILVHWQRTSYLEPKIKVIIGILAVLIICACGVALAYVFGLTYPGKDCYNELGNSALFRKEDSKCFKPVACMGAPLSCVAWDKDMRPFCGRFNFTTRLCLV